MAIRKLRAATGCLAIGVLPGFEFGLEQRVAHEIGAAGTFVADMALVFSEASAQRSVGLRQDD